MLADDHKMLREALRALLDKEPDIEVAGEAGDGMAVLGLVAEAKPDVVVMDIAMPGLNGVDATRRLAVEHPEIKVIALSAYSDKRFVMEMLDAGAVGYVVKAAAGDELMRAIRAITRGQTYLCPEVGATLVETVRGSAARGDRAGGRLGRREQEVLTFLAEGHSSPEIAALLHIAPSTVEVHRRNIMRKLDLHSVAELTKYAIREGLTSV